MIRQEPPGESVEYRALRATIRERGTARAWVFMAGVAVWAALTLTLFALALAPIATLVPLVALAAAFETVLALHTGVERIGRYLLVFHHDEWEQVAGSFGRPQRAVSTDALFTTLFLIATLVNLTPLLLTSPIVQELLIVGTAHAVFVARILLARAAAGRQRAVDTERFRQLARKD